MKPAKTDTVTITLRLPASLKTRLHHHAVRKGHGNASKLARHAIDTLIRVLDQEEASPQ